MGKFANLEIIPLDDNSPPMNNQPHSFRQNIPPNNMSRLPFLSDGLLIPRVRKYLESNVDKTYVDITIMADDLQRMYKEYARRKRGPFRSSVKKAYNVVLQNYGLEEGNVTSSEELSEESGGESNYDDSMNNQLMDMYNRPPPKPIQPNELPIDISSEDSNDNTSFPTINEKFTNGASTSLKSEITITSQKVPVVKPIEEVKPLSNATSNEQGKKRKISPSLVVSQNVVKRKKVVCNVQESPVSFKDVGGLEQVLINVCKHMMHFKHPEIRNRYLSSQNVHEKISQMLMGGFLLYGPPGCGKSLLARAIAGEMQIPLLEVTATQLVGGISGESEERIRNLFDQAVAQAPCVLFIDEIDSIANSRQNAQKDMERRIVAQLLTSMDELSTRENGKQIFVIGATNRPDAIDPALRRGGRFENEICIGIPDVRARTQILKVLTRGLKLASDFDYEKIASCTPGFAGADLMQLTKLALDNASEIQINNFNEKQNLERKIALQNATQELLKKQNLQAEAAKKSLSEADIVISDVSPKKDTTEIDVVGNQNTSDAAVVVIDDDKTEQINVQNPAATLAPETSIENLENLVKVLQEPKSELDIILSCLHSGIPRVIDDSSIMCLTTSNFITCLKSIQPSAKREGFATVPDVTWADVGSLTAIREELQLAILAPVKYPDLFKRARLTIPAGIMFCGPPGCGKTLLAKAIANEAGINFLSVNGPELLNMYVGESERAVRTCFHRARNSAPCVIFFDEIDALCPPRGEEKATDRVVNQMLTEMDGVTGGRNGIFLLAATNRPDRVDPAVLRPGRFEKVFYIGIPTAEDRINILRTITRNGTDPQLAADVDLELIGRLEQCEGYTGADLHSLVREATLTAIKELMIQGNPDQPFVITGDHFNKALFKIRKSVSDKDLQRYESYKKKYSISSLINGVEEMEYS